MRGRPKGSKNKLSKPVNPALKLSNPGEAVSNQDETVKPLKLSKNDATAIEALLTAKHGLNAEVKQQELSQGLTWIAHIGNLFIVVPNTKELVDMADAIALSYKRKMTTKEEREKLDMDFMKQLLWDHVVGSEDGEMYFRLYGRKTKAE